MALQLHIESLIFCSEHPITLKELKEVLDRSLQNEFSFEDLVGQIERIRLKYDSEEFPFQLVDIAEGYQFLTKGAYFNTISQYLRINSRKKLSKVALETLAIIAYKQPVTKSELESIRGVNCDYSIQKLLEKELIEIAGRLDGPGKPLTYSTSEKFMNYFGLKSIKDLPKLKDFKDPETQIGEPEALEITQSIDDESE